MKISNLFTEKDNTTLDPIRIFGVAFAVVNTLIFQGLAVYSALKLKAPFDAHNYGDGLALLWGVVAVAITFKAMTERT